MIRIAACIVALALLGGSATVVLPEAERALSLRLAADDPAHLAELRLQEAFSADAAAKEVETALAADDIEMAESFLALADARGIAISGELRNRVKAARTAKEQVRRIASRFSKGFVTGNAEGVEGLAGAAVGDLLVYGDIRDLVREGAHWVRGEKIDPVMAGLATAGLAVTAGTYFMSGAGTPARAGVSIFKVARRTGRMSAGLAADAARLARSGRAARAVDSLADLGRIESKAGARAALEGIRHADEVADLARVGRLAEKNGTATLAVLKTLGRGALVLGAGAVTGALWVMGAATNIFLLVVTVCTIFAWLVRGFWRTGTAAWRVGRFTAVRMAAPA
jgi:hypothetical protein